jgi:glycosyltransferase 2 family protein
LRKLLLAVSQTFYVGLGALLGFEFLRKTSQSVLGGPGLEWLMIASTAILGLASAAIVVGLVHGAPGARLFSMLSKVRSQRLGGWLLAHRDRFVALDGHFSVALGLKWTQLIVPTVLLFVAWLCETFETWLILRILGIEIGFIEVWAFEPALSLLRHLVFFVPAGLGFQDVGYVAFLRAAGVEDALSRGSAFVVLKRAKELFWAAVGLGLLALMGRRGKEVRA